MYSGSVTILRGDDALEFVHTWRPEDATTEFVTPEWILASWKHLPEIGEPAVLVVGEPSSWCALSLSESSGPRGSRMVVAGAPLGDEHDICTNDPERAAAMAAVLVSALDRLAAGGTEVKLESLAPEGHLAQALSAVPTRWSLCPEPAPEITLTNLRVNPVSHARRIRRLASTGPVKFDTVAGARLTIAEVEAFVRRRLRFWAVRGRLQELPDVERLPSFPLFMAEAMQRLAARHMARIRVLRVDGRPVAEDLYIGPETDELFYMGSYDPEFGAYSPGRIVLDETLLDLASSPAVRVRTGRGDEAYKMAAGAGNEYIVTALPISRES